VTGKNLPLHKIIEDEKWGRQIYLLLKNKAIDNIITAWKI
jgi:hypothetical protein